jgi:hypothetical protein
MYGPKGWEGVRGDWKVRGGHLIPGKGPEWMGILHNEQDIGLPSKWGFFSSTFDVRGYAQIIYYVLPKYKNRILVCRLKINYAWSTSSCV